METQYNDMPKDWQNLFAITWYFSICFTINEVKKIIHYTEDFIIRRFVISRFHCSMWILGLKGLDMYQSH